MLYVEKCIFPLLIVYLDFHFKCLVHLIGRERHKEKLIGRKRECSHHKFISQMPAEAGTQSRSPRRDLTAPLQG